MKNRLFISLGLAAALMTAGCAGKNAGQAQPEEAPAAETVQTTENTENAENAGTQDEACDYNADIRFQGNARKQKDQRRSEHGS